MKGLRFADSQESRFQASKRSTNVLVNGPFAVIQGFCFQAANFRTWSVPNCKFVNLLIVRNGIFILQNVQIKALPSCKGSICWCSGIAYTVCKSSDMGIPVMKGLRFVGTQESCFETWNFHIWVVLPWYVVDLLMFRNCVLNLKYVKISAVPYLLGVHLRIVRNGIFSLRNVQIRANKLMPRNRVFRLRNVPIWVIPSC